MSRLRSFRSAGGLLVLTLAVVAVGCGGSSPTPPGQIPVPGSGSLVVLGRDAPLDNLVKFEITVTGITLNPGNVVVPLPAGGVRLELTSLQITTDMIRLAQNSIPAGAYTSVTLTLANPEIEFRDDATRLIVEVEPPLQSVSVTIDVNFSIAQDQLTALLFDFDLTLMVQTNISDAIIGINPTGNISVSLVDVAGEQGEIEDEVGLVVSVDATNNTFLFEPFSNCQQITITVDATTVFEDFDPVANDFASLQTDQIVEVDADLRVDGTILAEKVEFEDDTMEDELEGLIVDVNRVGGNATDFDLVLFDVAPCTATLPASDLFTVDLATSGTIDFDIDEDDLSVAPTLFDGPEDIERGQKVDVDPVEPLGTDPVTAEKIKLKDQTIRGTVGPAPISSLGFELIPASALFPDASITVEISIAATEFEDLPNGTNDLFQGRPVRVKGLLVLNSPGNLILEAKRVDGTP